MFNSFFEARDAWEDTVLSQDEPLPRQWQAALAVFRVLLAHTIYDQESPAYGWVVDKFTGHETLGKLTGYNKRQTVGDALALLAILGR